MRPANAWLRRAWGDATAILHRARRLGWVDLLVALGVAGLLYGLLDLMRQWGGPHRQMAEIDLSVAALPRYAFYSLSRGLLAYIISLFFTLGYGYWAAKDRVAERVLIPALDILQSIPVLTFLPVVVPAMAALTPGNNIGLELASVLLIFTGQAWNMTFSFYHSLRSIPQDQQEVGTLFRFSLWQRFKWVEVPFATMGLVWNSMMSMAGGWFFLMISEAYEQADSGGGGGTQSFMVPGLGSYMSVAVKEGRVDAEVWAIVAMVLMIIALDQLLWRPVVVWAQKFRVEEGGAQPDMSSWLLDWLRRSGLLEGIAGLWARLRPRRRSARKATVRLGERRRSSLAGPVASAMAFIILLGLLGYGAFRLLLLLRGVGVADWWRIICASGVTLGRVLISTAVGTLWALPAGLAIGLSPRLSRLLQPVVQVVASFPAPMLFPMVFAGLLWSGVPLGTGSILLMLMGTQWYILFNVIAGAMAVPADLREAARSYRIGRWQRFWTLYLPAVFPQLVTGWVTAAGGAWNASIVAEYVTYKDREYRTFGIGDLISDTTAHNQWPLAAASALVMSTVVVTFNRTVWRRLYRLAEERFSLNK